MPVQVETELCNKVSVNVSAKMTLILAVATCIVTGVTLIAMLLNKPEPPKYFHDVREDEV